jgi:type I restriction enzyme M protein
MSNTSDITDQLWDYCAILRGEGLSYTSYLTELSYLLFLKMLEDTDQNHRLPAEYSWAQLQQRVGMDQWQYYKQLLLNLGDANTISDSQVLGFFNDAKSSLSQPTQLAKLCNIINQLDWHTANDDGLGLFYEKLLEEASNEKKSKVGDYFTPRVLIRSIVNVMQPQVREVVQDPTAGSGGFLVIADQYIKERTDNLYMLNAEDSTFQREQAFMGMELVAATHRLCSINLLLHKIRSQVRWGDTLSPDGAELPKADLILANPPFGNKAGGGRPNRQDFTITNKSSTRQFAFVEHIIRSLKPGGRAAIVLPDNVLFEDNTGRELRQFMLDRCNLHTILRLPTGIFSAQGVKTNVVFLQRGHSDRGNTAGVWFYDMRSNMRSFGKNNPLRLTDFAEFEAAYGSDPNGNSPRTDQGESGRFRYFSRDYIRERNDNLDITWLRDASADHDDQLQQPDQLAEAIVLHLRNALDQFDSLSAELNDPSLIQANV